MQLHPRHLLIAAALVLAGCGSAVPAASPAPETPSISPPAPAAAPASPAPPPVEITYPARGHRKWTTAPAQAGKAAGHSGRLLRYRVLVEQDIKGLVPADFAGTVTTTLTDPRSWTAGGQYRLQRVGPGDAYNFTIYLATPDTRDTLCAGAPDGYTSCRNKDNVVLNVARWVKGAPSFKAPLATYRQYMVNHEVGHRLGQGHMLCPGSGEPAPVMQQQTLGMHGCTVNPWPYPDRKHFYTGRSGAYDDTVPPRDRGN
ncbi:DUF3152 domain-containing protein [Actinoplanes sp. NPDC051411]|uniref:DUF3152 domain-containing protein n=1 Tax=Actinoplanes sp. NPDC051411 TaxID=3155522 RepID=UPI0034241D66